MIDANIKNNKYFLLVGISFSIYSIIEISDCVYILLIAFNIAPNVYLEMGMIIPEIRFLLEQQPIVFFPFFLSFTLMRILATIGIFKNRKWGCYIGLFSLGLTMILTILFIPFGFFELFICSVILILLIIGFFDKTPLIT